MKGLTEPFFDINKGSKQPICSFHFNSYLKMYMQQKGGRLKTGTEQKNNSLSNKKVRHSGRDARIQSHGCETVAWHRH